MQDKNPSDASGDRGPVAVFAALRKETEALVRTTDTFQWLTSDVAASLQNRATTLANAATNARTAAKASQTVNEEDLEPTLKRMEAEARAQRAIAKVLGQLAKKSDS